MQACQATPVAALAAAILLVGGAIDVQVAPSPALGLTAERLTRSRWLHGRQQSRFTIFRDARHWVRIDSVAERPAERVFHLQLQRQNSAPYARATLRTGRTGRWVDATTDLTESRGNPSWWIRNEAAEVSLLEARLWGLVPSVRPARLAQGVRWTDTLDLATEEEGFRQSLRGMRVSVVLGDTTIAGRRLWVIGDSAFVRYQERALEAESGTIAIIDRDAEGVLRGHHLYDPILRLSLVRYDTTVLSGEAMLRYPDGRAYPTPARYESTGSWSLRDSASHVQRREELDSAFESRWTGVVRLPVDDVERAVNRGDQRLVDSLLALWERVKDPNEYARLQRVLSWGGPAVEGMTRERRLAAGDTAFRLEGHRYELLIHGRRLDVSEVRSLLPFLEDPGLVFAFGVSRDLLYEWIVSALNDTPPAATPDTSRWPCTRQACQLLAEQWFRATEPRLRDVGLAALVTTDPARWADTLLAHAGRRSGLLRSIAERLAHPWPGSGADWRAWRELVIWQSCFNGRTCRTGVSSPRVETLRLHQARGVRDLAGEIATRFRTETSDSARLVFGVLRLAFARDVSHDSIASRFLARSAPLRTLAEKELEHLFQTDVSLAMLSRRNVEVTASRVDSTVLTEIVDQYLAAMYTAAPQWQSLDDALSRRAPRMGPSADAQEPRPYFLADQVPSILRGKWAGLVPFISREEWNARPHDEERQYTTIHIEGPVGPFARVSIERGGRYAGRDRGPARGSASGASFFLMKFGASWVVVLDGGSWIA